MLRRQSSIASTSSDDAARTLLESNGLVPERRSVTLSSIAGKVSVYEISWGKWWGLERRLHVPLHSMDCPCAERPRYKIVG